jgi:hypothetical protein
MIMNATETMLKVTEKRSFNFSLRDLKTREHYKFIATVCNSGFPTTQAQANFFIKNVCFANRVLNSSDIEKIESLLNRHGFYGDYTLTKSKKWARIQNGLDVSDALKLEFKL